MLIDAHCHLHFSSLDSPLGVSQNSLSSLCHRSVVNGTCEADWPEVVALSHQHPELVHPSFGLHPWKVRERSARWEQALRKLLLDLPHSAVGECGLDRWKRPYDLNDQIQVFRTHLKLASELDRPITIHCLQAWGALLETLRTCDSLPRRLLLHSFCGSIEVARELSSLGAHFSLSGYFLHSRKASQLAVFRQLPPEQIHFESDAPEMSPPSQFQRWGKAGLNHPADFPLIASALSAASGVSLQQATDNTQNFFRISL